MWLFRGLLLVVLLPGLAAILTLSAPSTSSAASVQLRYSFLVTVGVIAMGLLRRRRPYQPLCDARSWIACGVLVAATPIVFVLSGPAQATAVTLVGAAVEEVLYRLELPFALATIMGAHRMQAFAAILIAQVVFALSHFGFPVNAEPTDVIEFVRLLGCGLFLALVLRASASLTLCIALHFVLNESLWGLMGTPRPVSVMAVAALVATAALCLALFEATTGRHRPLLSFEGR